MIRPGRRRGAGRRSERGSVSLEVAVLMPGVLLAVFGLIQGALVAHARHVALAAASEGLAATASFASARGEGRRAAFAFIEAAGGSDVLLDAEVEVRRSDGEASVSVSGRAPSLVPGFDAWTVTQTVSGPVERFTTGRAP